MSSLWLVAVRAGKALAFALRRRIQRELERLLCKNQAGTLTEREQQRLDKLQRKADRVMLRKVRAAVLLRFRGHRLPTLEELRRFTLYRIGVPR